MPNTIAYVDLQNGLDTAKTITGATKANPCVITSTAHGFSNGDTVIIYNVGGMTQLNGIRYTVANVATDTFELSGINSTGYTTYTSGGSASKYGTATLPFLTVNTAVAALTASASPEIRVAKTVAYQTVTDANCTWTANSVTVNTSADISGKVKVGDYVGRATAAGNGAEETFYRVQSTTSSTLTIEFRYGGTTGTDTAAIRVLPIGTTGGLNISIAQTGPSNATAMTSTINQMWLSGGWNLSGTPAQDGETWFRPNGTRGSYGGISWSGSSCPISKLNMVDVGVAYALGASCTVTNCTSEQTSYNSSIALTNVFDGCLFQGSSGTGTLYGVFTVQNSSFIGSAVHMSNMNTTNVITNCKLLSNSYAGSGVALPTNYVLTGITVCKNHAFGITLGVGSVINGCAFSTCGTGVTGAAGSIIKSCTFTDCTTSGINAGSNGFNGMLIDSCTFTNCAKGIDQSSGSALCGSHIVQNCTFTAPTTYGIANVANAGIIKIIGCTIDGASIAKAYQVTASGYGLQQYSLQGSFGQTGSIFGVQSVMQSPTVYRTTAPSTALANTATTTTANLDLKIFSSYVNSGASRTYSFYTKASNASWSGSITVKWKLNGALIKTESTPITSISSGSWDSRSYTCDSSLITSDGELSLEFGAAMNAYTIYIDDCTVS